MLKKYNGFLLEKLTDKLTLVLEGEIKSTSDFLMKLNKVSEEDGNVGKIAQSIYDTITGEDYYDDDNIKQNYFDVSKEDDKVSFVQHSKVPDDWDESENASLPYTMKGRNEIKIGRIVKYLCDLIYDENDNRLDFKPTDKDIEQFVNIFKSIKVSNDLEFKLIKGDDISNYYNEEKYYSDNGSLGGSCMKDEPSSFFQVYSNNTKKVRLLIYVDKDDKIRGRALVWKLTTSPCDAEYFMDRVYVNSDSDEFKFKNFANEKGWLYKKYMNSHVDKNVLFKYKGKDVAGVVTVKLDADFDEYPFIDTMCFTDDKLKILSNVAIEDGHYLQSVMGECETCSDCNGELIHSIIIRFLGKCDIDDLCDGCCGGHKELASLGIPTDYNGLKKNKK